MTAVFAFKIPTCAPCDMHMPKLLGVGRWLTTLLSLSLVQRVGACQVFDEMAESNASSFLRWCWQSIAPSADRLVLFWVGHGNGFAMLLQFCAAPKCWTTDFICCMRFRCCDCSAMLLTWGMLHVYSGTICINFLLLSREREAE